MKESEQVLNIQQTENRRIWSRRKMFWPAAGIGLSELGRSIGEIFVFGQHLTGISGGVMEHGGDFSLAYLAGWITYSEVFGKIRNAMWRGGLSAGMSAAAVFLADGPIPISALGVRDPRDLPAGALGLLAWLGTNKLVEMRAQKKYPDIKLKP